MRKIRQAELNKLYPSASLALLRLTQTKKFDEIGVGDIARETGVSRQYFYRFYTDKIDLFYDVFLSDVETASPDVFHRGAVKSIFLQLYTHVGLYRSVLSSSYALECHRAFVALGTAVAEALAENSPSFFLSPKERSSLEFYLHGVCSLFIENLFHPRHSPEELSEIVLENIPASIEYLLHEEATLDRILFKTTRALGAIEPNQTERVK